jgi:hypothetical protein
LIKGNLTVKSFWGYSENAVKIHLWVAISSYLLLAWIKAALKSPLTITEVSKVVEVLILSRLISENFWMFQSRSLKIKMSMN